MLEELDDIEDMKLYEEAKKYESKPVAAEDAFRLLDSKRKKKKWNIQSGLRSAY